VTGAYAQSGAGSTVAELLDVLAGNGVSVDENLKSDRV
jgi:hypothetical protein